jgi:hypothetical protein
LLYFEVIDMNLLEVEKQVLPYLIKLAESPPVQAEIQAAKAAILNIVEAEAARAIPWGLRTIARILRWIIKKAKGTRKIMSGSANIIVQNSTGVLEGATVSYVYNSLACEATTDSTGVATVSGLDAGTYTFTAALTGYTSASIDLTVADDITVTGTITLTEEESTVSEKIEDAAEEAATTAATTALTTALTSAVSSDSGVITWATTEIARLTAEIGTTKDVYVKYVRNPIEIAALAAALAAATAGVKKAIEELAEKAQ